MASDTMTAARGTVDAAGMPNGRKATVIVVGVAVGVAMAVLWSARLVDDSIGVTVASGLLGHDARTGGVGTGLAGGVFAFVAGLAGTFTACNVAAFSAVGPLMNSGGSAVSRVRPALAQVGWVGVGLVATAAAYGAAGAAIGTRIPQLNTHTVGNNVPIRVVQSAIVFTLLGLAFLWLGLAAIRVLPDPLRRAAARWPEVRPVVMGALIGGFLIGRPYPLFFELFSQAARTHNPLYGAATFALTALGNVLVMGIVFLVLAAGTGGRYQRWLAARPDRLAAVTATALIIGGVFMLFYWGVRLPAHFGYGWFPRMPWS